MNMLIVGSWRWHQYEDAFATGLIRNGVVVTRFDTTRFFLGNFGRVQLTLPLPSHALFSLNRELLKVATEKQFKYILFWRPTHVLPSTLKKLNKLGIQLISYNNDDPFGPSAHGNVPWHHHLLWFWYQRCLPHFDKNFFYRRVNCGEALALGAKNAEVLMSYFVPQRDRPVELTEADQKRYASDVVFVGHYEPDGRKYMIHALMDAGVQVKIWGGSYWSREVLGSLYDRLHPIVPVEGESYAKALAGAKICLAFLSKINRDSYTRRCFEIPACGRVMLAERTSELLRMFKEDQEACFFSTVEELVNKVRWLLDNPKIRENIAQAGMRRVWADGHDVESRTRQFLSMISSPG
jgi:spore maturation protein CgeB